VTTLKLIYTQDNQTTPTDTFDLMCFTGNKGFQIANNGWVPIIGSGKVQESLTLHAKGDSQDEVIAYLETILKKWHNYVLWSQDYAEERSVWLQVQWENETNIRQARLVSFNFQINSSPFGEFWQNANFTEATVTFERMEWEQGPAYPSSIFIPAGQSVFAGVIALPSSIVFGDVNARVVNMNIAGNTTFTAGRVWAAFRRNRHGEPLSFVPTWNASKATMLSDSSAGADTTAINGQRVTTIFTTATIKRRFNLYLTNAISPATTYNEQRGKFLVLMRAMVSDDTTITRARIAYGTGSASGNNFTTLTRVEITTPLPIIKTWKLYEMGVVSIPNARVPRYSSAANNALLMDYFIGVDAERVSGTGYLYIDSLILLPVDEAFVKTTNDAVPLASGKQWYIFQNDLSDVSGYTGTTTSVDAGFEVEQRSFGVPPKIDQDNIGLIIAGDDVGTDNIHGGVTLGVINLSYIPRWTLARGVE
jgi:hypothetical protein